MSCTGCRASKLQGVHQKGTEIREAKKPCWHWHTGTGTTLGALAIRVWSPEAQARAAVETESLSLYVCMLGNKVNLVSEL
jgi:hypothetical protein